MTDFLTMTEKRQLRQMPMYGYIRNGWVRLDLAWHYRCTPGAA